MKVLFVCLGNVGRSPMAEAVMRHRWESMGRPPFELVIDSAGTDSYHVGQSPLSGTQKILKQNGISWENIRSRLLKPGDGKEFDYIIGMDLSNIKNIGRVLKDTGNVYLLSSFVENANWQDVPDPYYTGNFEAVYEKVTEGVDAFIRYLLENHG